MKWVYLELHGVHGDGVGQTGGAPRRLTHLFEILPPVQ